MKTLKISLLALTSALSLAACVRDGVTDPDVLSFGQFQGWIQGTLDGSLSGEARSGSSTAGFHDLIVLTDHRQGLEVTLYHDTDEFTEGHYRIGDGVTFDENIVAYVRVLDTGEYFDSLDGDIQLSVVRGDAIIGSARFRAESDEVFGETVDVEVSFHTGYDSRLDFNLSPSFSAGAKKE